MTKVFLAGAMTLALVASPAAAEVMAKVGTQTIDRAQLDKEVAPKLMEIERQRYEALREGLDGLVAESLMTQEAKARGVSLEDFVKTELEDKVTAPSDQDIQTLYDSVKEQLQGATLDQVRERLVGYLAEQKLHARRSELLDELKKKYPTTTFLRPPKVTVGTGSRAGRGGGNAASVTIVEFSDYECPFCKRAEPTVQQVLTAYGDKVQFYYRDYPLPFHERAQPAAEAAHCVNAQGKFWPYHEKLMSSENLDDATLKALAKEVGVDEKKFDECVAKKQFKDAVAADLADGEKAGVNGTPAFFINGRLLDGAQPFEKFKEVIDEELAWAAEKKK
jgi:protein-disulfide isomerase